MATYVIGDIQGCYDTLQRLLAEIRFDAAGDRLWLVGDLVNRGPKSLQVLRWARDLGDRVVAVLGNHDLHLLWRAVGVDKKKKRDTLDKVLDARDRLSLIDWLRRCPLIHVEHGVVMVHAGLHPAWTVDDAVAAASEVAALIRADGWQAHAAALAADPPPDWSASLLPGERARAALAVLTRLRMLTAEGRLRDEFAGAPDQALPGDVPWFAVPGARWRDHAVVFGHWSALGLHQDSGVTCLDTGCVWGQTLTALRLDDRAIIQVPAVDDRV